MLSVMFLSTALMLHSSTDSHDSRPRLDLSGYSQCQFAGALNIPLHHGDMPFLRRFGTSGKSLPNLHHLSIQVHWSRSLSLMAFMGTYLCCIVPKEAIRLRTSTSNALTVLAKSGIAKRAADL